MPWTSEIILPDGEVITGQENVCVFLNTLARKLPLATTLEALRVSNFDPTLLTFVKKPVSGVHRVYMYEDTQKFIDINLPPAADIHLGASNELADTRLPRQTYRFEYCPPEAERPITISIDVVYRRNNDKNLPHMEKCIKQTTGAEQLEFVRACDQLLEALKREVMERLILLSDREATYSSGY